jgi:hypothetical protein
MKSCLNPSSVVAVQSATAHPCLHCWCTDQEVGVLEYHMLWDVSLDSGITSTAATQTRRSCTLLGKCVKMDVNLFNPVDFDIILHGQTFTLLGVPT